jgi:hypothetical protein
METKKHLLSKSTFMLGCQCPKRLYLHKFKPELRNPDNEEQASIFSSGTNVGLIARELFPEGVNAEPQDSFTYHLSVELTQKYIQEGATIIYEACFNYNGVLCAIDVLVKENNNWQAYEVKGSTKIKEQFILDAAFQYHVITQSGINLEDISIVYLNNQYVKRGEIDVQRLFIKESVLNKALDQQSFIKENIAQFKTLISKRKEPIIAVGEQCYKPYDCNFTNYCWTNEEVEEQGSTREAFINKDYLKEFIGELQYPLFYFDFETLMPAIPEFDESRPYQQIPFQYSLHIQENKDTDLKHVAFLGNGINDPRKPLIKELLSSLGKVGSIIVWNQTFEISRLKEIARDFPQYEIEIKKIIERIVDLMIPFRKKQYYHPDFNESYSIKRVLPVLVPELSYNELIIQNGASASSKYAELKKQEVEIQNQQRVQLLEYCKLDTLAMVRILENIKSIVK